MKEPTRERTASGRCDLESEESSWSTSGSLAPWAPVLTTERRGSPGFSFLITDLAILRKSNVELLLCTFGFWLPVPPFMESFLHVTSVFTVAGSRSQ